MSVLNHTIDDISPLIRYAGEWSESTPASDSQIVHYSNTTFTLCNTSGSSATFTFNGTAVWIFGAKRPNHGSYSVSLDSTVRILHGHADPAIYQTPIFNATNLPDTTHTVIITNQQTNDSRSFLDLDFITWTSTPRKHGKETTTLHSSEADFSYAPQSAWSTNETASSTSSDQASAVLTFMGDEVTLYGTVGPNSGVYAVSIDDASPSTYNANKLNTTDQVPLFFASDLGPGTHTLNITHTPRQAGQVLAIDYAVAARADASSPSASANVGSGGGSSNSNSNSGLGKGAIAGIAVGVVAVITAAFLLFMLFWHRRRRRSSIDNGEGERTSSLTPFVLSPDSDAPAATSGDDQRHLQFLPMSTKNRGGVNTDANAHPFSGSPPNYDEVFPESESSRTGRTESQSRMSKERRSSLRTEATASMSVRR